MNIKQFVTQIESHAPTGWALYAAGSVQQYNMNKIVSDTIVMVLPEFPLFWRQEQECKKSIRLEFYLLKGVQIYKTEAEQQQHLPYEGLETMVVMHAAAIEFIRSLATDSYIRVNAASDIEFYPSVAGVTANSQAVARFTVNAVMYFKATDIFDYSLNTEIQ